MGTAVAGVALMGPFGIALMALGGLTLVGAFLFWQGKWATEHLAARLRAPAPATRTQAAGPGLGVIREVLPDLHVVEVTGRGAAPLGVIGDGQGFAAVLELEVAGNLRLDLAALAAQVRADPAELAGFQVLIEQFPLPALDVTERFGPTMVYRRLPTTAVPVLRRVWLVLRHEPLWAPEATERRGGGAAGARTALVAAAARLRVHLVDNGFQVHLLGLAATTELLAGVGDPSQQGRFHADAWLTQAGAHCCLAITGDWSKLLMTAASIAADRCVVSVAVELDGHSAVIRSIARLFATDQSAVANARAALIATGLVEPLPNNQPAGVVATLPLGGGARDLTSAIGLVRG
ncbi:MAG TPA: type VII secretion protein EccE [Kutzneria sp.]